MATQKNSKPKSKKPTKTTQKRSSTKEKGSVKKTTKATKKKPVKIDDNFNQIKRKFELVGWEEQKDYVLLSRRSLKTLFKVYARYLAENMDETWYLNTYPDVEKNMKDVGLNSAKDHFIEYGFFENRIPYPISIDYKQYLEKNPDLKTSMGNLKGKDLEAAAKEHFIEHGYREGREF